MPQKYSYKKNKTKKQTGGASSVKKKSLTRRATPHIKISSGTDIWNEILNSEDFQTKFTKKIFDIAKNIDKKRNKIRILEGKIREEDPAGYYVFGEETQSDKEERYNSAHREMRNLAEKIKLIEKEIEELEKQLKVLQDEKSKKDIKIKNHIRKNKVNLVFRRLIVEEGPDLTRVLRPASDDFFSIEPSKVKSNLDENRIVAYEFYEDTTSISNKPPLIKKDIELFPTTDKLDTKIRKIYINEQKKSKGSSSSKSKRKSV